MQRATDTQLGVFTAAWASLGAGLAHLAVTPGHWREWVLSGAFFLALAVFQLVWAAAVVRFPNRPLVVLGVAANLASMALWGISRMWGIPAGPNAGVPEPVGPAGILTVLLESVAVASAVWFLLPRQQPAVLSTGGHRFAVGGVVLAVAALTGPGMATAVGHGHTHSSGHGHAETGGHGESTTGAQKRVVVHHHHHKVAPGAGPSAETISPQPASTDRDTGRNHEQPGTTRPSGDGHDHEH